MNSSAGSPQKLTVAQWLVILIAIVGFAFDTYELLMLPLIGGPAISELLHLPPGHPAVPQWMGTMLWLTALCGGIFGLLGGWLTDRFGRKTVLLGSILVYSLSPVAAAMSTSIEWFVFFRCTTFIGVCVEFIAAITWLAELFPDKRQKEVVLGVTQAFASIGGLLVTAANAWAVKSAATLAAIPNIAEPFNAHASWRYTLITGLLPAIPIVLMLPFVPESQAWVEKRKAGTLRRPSIGELFSPQLRRVTLITAALSACGYAAAFGALQLTPTQIAPGMSTLAEQRKALKPLQDEAKSLIGQYNKIVAANSDPANPERKEVMKKILANRKAQEPFDQAIKAKGNEVQGYQETGGLIGRVVLAILLVSALTRRSILRLFLVPGLVAFPLTYLYLFSHEPEMMKWGMAVCGFLTVAQFSYFGEYLPRAFPLHLRGTGGGFATNVGGRMIGTSAALLTTRVIAPHLSGSPFEQVAIGAAIVGTSVFVIGLILSCWLPEPHAENQD